MPRKKVEQEVLEQTTEISEQTPVTEETVQETAENVESIPKDEAIAQSSNEVEDANNPEEMDTESAEIAEAAEITESTESDETTAAITESTGIAEISETAVGEEPENTPENPATKMKMLKINVHEERDDYNEEEIAWHELVVAYHNRKAVPVRLAGLERMQLGNVVVAYYKMQRVVIPITEMMLDISKDRRYQDKELPERLQRICNTMLGSEIDVVIKGIDNESESAVASRADAMIQKRKKFYLTPLEDGLPQVREGRLVEGRIIALTPMVARVEVFGIEITLSASEISWEWLSDITQKFHVGDKLPLLIKHIEGDNVDNLKIKVDAKSVIQNTPRKNLEKCVVQGKYIGEVSSVRKGVAFINLRNGVNAIAHTNYDKRYPGKGDIVSFVITRINHEYGNVAGIISRIIKQNI